MTWILKNRKTPLNIFIHYYYCILSNIDLSLLINNQDKHADYGIQCDKYNGQCNLARLSIQSYYYCSVMKVAGVIIYMPASVLVHEGQPMCSVFTAFSWISATVTVACWLSSACVVCVDAPFVHASNRMIYLTFFNCIICFKFREINKRASAIQK